MIIDAVARPVQEYKRKYFGRASVLVLYSHVDSASGSHHIPTRRKNTDNHKLFRCHKPTLNRLSTDRFNESTLGDKINTLDADSEHSGDEDDGEPLLEIDSEQSHNLSPGDDAAIEEYYAKGVCQVGQLIMKKVLKKWIR